MTLEATEEVEETTETTEKTDSEAAAAEAAAKEQSSIDEETLKVSQNFDKKLAEVESEDESDSPPGDDTPSDSTKTGDDKDSAETTGDDKDSAGKTEETTEQQTESVINDDLLNRALDAGFDKDEALSYKNPDDLRRTLDIIGKISSESTDQQTQDTGQQTTTKTDTSIKPFEPEEFKLEFENKEQLAPEITGVVEKLNQHYAEQMKKMKEHYDGQLKSVSDQVATSQKAVESKAALEFETQFDKLVTELGADYETLVGKGAGRELDDKSEAMANRNKIIRTMNIIDKTYTADKQQLPPLNEVFKQAVGVVFRGQTEKITNKKLAATVTARSKQSINKPTDRSPKAKTADEEIIEISENFDREHQGDTD